MKGNLLFSKNFNWYYFFSVKNKFSCKKVDCQNCSCSELTQLKFENKTCVFKDRGQVLLFLLNTLLKLVKIEKNV